MVQWSSFKKNYLNQHPINHITVTLIRKNEKMKISKRKNILLLCVLWTALII